MSLGVLDAGVAIGWMARSHPAFRRVESLLRSCRMGHVRLILSVVNLAEVLRHTAELTRGTGVDALAVLRGYGVEVHAPDEAIAYRVSKLRTSLADGFAAATALELRGRLHTTDRELVSQLRGLRLSVTLY